ncbi:MAG: DUF4416 family protein [Patescibacteria group bacterium]|nr:DUF4416 family protein [Patescibacteria group bacterium]
MGQPAPHSPALLLLAAFSRYDDALAWARDRAVAAFGPVALESPGFHFDQTDYYQSTMGDGLQKVFFVFERPYLPDQTAETKLLTNRWEEQYAAEHPHAEPRPLNLDPGYLTLGKVVLSSTKDFAHRIYLGHGIYAEVTLFFRHGKWEHHQFTFTDYRRADYQAFFTRCRDALHRRLREEADA